MHAPKMPGHLIRRLNQISTLVFTTHMQKAGFNLTSVQFAAMDAIAANPGIDQAGVAREIAFDRATISGVIDRLEQKSYVKRSVSTHDRRARALHLTTKGRNAFEKILPIVTALQDEILSGLSQNDRATFLDLADTVIRSAANIGLTDGT